MRPRFPDPPERSDLLGLELHELVRDYPETLSILRRHGVDLREEGTRRVAEVAVPEDPGASSPESLVDDLYAALAWRRPR